MTSAISSQWVKHYWPYFLVTLLVLGPLLAPGYILTMDMVFVPHPPIPTELNASFPLYVLLHFVSYILPGDVLQKILLGTILVAAGIGMDRLLRQVSGNAFSRWAVVTTSLFYMTSAFVYERFMIGQWAVVAGYALLPFVIVALMRFLRTPTWWQLGWLVGSSLLLAVVSIHSLVPLIVVILLYVGTRWRQWRRFAPRLTAGLLVFLAMSSYWIIPAVTNNNMLSAALNGNANPHAFATHGGLLSLLRLQGIWAESYKLFKLPQEIILLPGVWQTGVWMLMITGLIVLWRRQRRLAILASALIVISCLVALISMTSLYREPHKIMVLAAIGMSLLLASGVNAWLKRIGSKSSLALPAKLLLCLLPLLPGAAMFWGFSGQLSARAYPPEWYALNQRLQQLPGHAPVIFVPWHLYQRYSFSPRIVANPAATFFENRRVIVSNDPEFAGVSPLKNDSLVSEVDGLLKAHPSDIADQLHRLGVSYIIFAEEPDYETFEFLPRDANVREIFHQGRLTLYEIKEI